VSQTSSTVYIKPASQSYAMLSCLTFFVRAIAGVPELCQIFKIVHILSIKVIQIPLWWFAFFL